MVRCGRPTRHTQRTTILSGDINGTVDDSDYTTNDFHGTFAPTISIPAEITVQLRIGIDGLNVHHVSRINPICRQAGQFFRAISHWLNQDGKNHQLTVTLVNSEVYLGRMNIAEEDLSSLAELHKRNELTIHGIDEEVIEHLHKLGREYSPPKPSPKMVLSEEMLTHQTDIANEMIRQMDSMSWPTGGVKHSDRNAA